MGGNEIERLSKQDNVNRHVLILTDVKSPVYKRSNYIKTTTTTSLHPSVPKITRKQLQAEQKGYLWRKGSAGSGYFMTRFCRKQWTLFRFPKISWEKKRNESWNVCEDRVITGHQKCVGHERVDSEPTVLGEWESMASWAFWGRLSINGN